MFRGPCIAVILLCGLTGCRGFTEASGPLPSYPTVLDLQATLVTTGDVPAGAAAWDCRIVLDLGLDRGLLAEIDDTLSVEGEPLAPVAISDAGHRIYEFEVPIGLDEVPRRSVEIVPPKVNGAPGQTIRLVGVTRRGGDTIRWTPGTDLVLPLDLPVVSPAPAPIHWRWSITLTGADGERFTIENDDRPPSEVVVPGAYVPGGTPDIEAVFDFYLFHYATFDVAYQTNVSMWGSDGWRVEVEGPASPEGS